MDSYSERTIDNIAFGFKLLFENNIDDFTCVLLVGSRSIGINNKNSDYDFVIVTPDPTRIGAPDPWGYVVRSIFGTRAEILVISTARFEEYLRELQTTGLIRDKHRPYKFLCAKPIMGSDRYARMMQGFDITLYMSVKEQMHTDMEVCIYEDILGALDCENKYILTVWARSLLEVNLDALLHSRGDFYEKPKWRLKRAGMLLQHNRLYEMCRELIVGSGKYLETDYHKTLSEYVQLSNSIKLVRLGCDIDDINRDYTSQPSTDHNYIKRDVLVQTICRPSEGNCVIVDSSNIYEIPTELGATYLCTDRLSTISKIKYRVGKIVFRDREQGNVPEFDIQRNLSHLLDLNLIKPAKL